MFSRRRAGAALATAVLVLSAVGAGPVAPAVAAPTLLCARDEVLRIVDRTVRRWNLYNRILPGSIGEAPTSAANAVHCVATMTGIAYERTPEGWLPRPFEEPRHYDVQVVGNRLFVQVLP